MEIEVRDNEKYKEVRISDNGFFFESGLLNEEEAKELALKFLSTAQELLDKTYY